MDGEVIMEARKSWEMRSTGRKKKLGDQVHEEKRKDLRRKLHDNFISDTF